MSGKYHRRDTLLGLHNVRKILEIHILNLNKQPKTLSHFTATRDLFDSLNASSCHKIVFITFRRTSTTRKNRWSYGRRRR